jgi:hypothetical protein
MGSLPLHRRGAARRHGSRAQPVEAHGVPVPRQRAVRCGPRAAPWSLSLVMVNPDGSESPLWSGEKLDGDTRAGTYARTGGLAQGPPTIELAKCGGAR